jgi:hypothetical protein
MDLVCDILFQKYNFLENNYEKNQQAYFPLSKLIHFRYYYYINFAKPGRVIIILSVVQVDNEIYGHIDY